MLNEIKSIFVVKKIFGFLVKRKKMEILKYNKKLMHTLNIELNDFQNYVYLKDLKQKYHLNIQENDINKIETLEINSYSNINKVLKFIKRIEFKVLKN